MNWTRAACALAGFAGLLRAALGMRVGVPGNDGAIYLWAAESLARDGDFAAPWTTVFHAGSAHVIALGMACGMDSYAAAVVMMALASALSVYLMACILRELGGDGGWGLLALASFAFGFQFVRLPADVYSESFALPCVLLSLLLALRGRAARSAAAAALAYAFRPEAILALLATLVLVRREDGRSARRERGIALGVAALGVAAYAVGAAIAGGQGVATTPKLDFMLPLGPLGALRDGAWAGALERLGHNVTRLPGAAVGGLDFAVFFVGIASLFPARARRARFVRVAVLWMGAHLAVLLAFQVKPRFFLMLAPLLYPLVAIGMSVPWRGRQLARILMLASLALACGRVALDFVDPPRRDKLVEIEVGRDLAAEFGADALLSALPRVHWAAGRRPLPPWPWTAEALLRDEARCTPVVRMLALRASPANRAAVESDGRFVWRECRGERVDLYVRP